MKNDFFSVKTKEKSYWKQLLVVRRGGEEKPISERWEKKDGSTVGVGFCPLSIGWLNVKRTDIFVDLGEKLPYA